MKISFNSKVVLGFVFAATFVYVLSCIIPNFITKFFVVGAISFKNPLDYFRLISYVLGHSSWEHLFGNLMFLLLLGPMLEEKYGHLRMFLMILVTALTAGLINALFFSTGILGASGIVFMFIILASFVGKKDGSIPIEFILVVIAWMLKEIFGAFHADKISQLGHLLGGICGAVFGYMIVKKPSEKVVET